MVQGGQNMAHQLIIGEWLQSHGIQPVGSWRLQLLVGGLPCPGPIRSLH